MNEEQIRSRRWLPWLLAAVILPLAGPAAAPAQETEPEREESAKPGINALYKSGNVAMMIGALENEDREVFTAREEIADLLAPGPGTVLADIGAGTGFLTEEFARRVGPDGKVYAVDISPEAMEHLAERASSQGLENLETVVCPEDSVGLPAISIDVAVICNSYHHFEYPESTMRSLHGALKPGGELIVIDRHRIPGVTDEWWLNHLRAGQELFTEEIVGIGFELVEEVEAPFLEENYVLRFRKVEEHRE